MHFIFPGTMYFPPADQASEEGILAVGGDLSAQRLILAYNNGIFPWYSEDDPILWWSPPQRMVVFPAEYTPPKNLRKLLRESKFSVTFNRDFRQVISRCRNAHRAGQDGTWISEEIIEAYCRLHAIGLAKSVEVWDGEKLVGGLYGVDLQNVFCGESMFSDVPGASKLAFVRLIEKLRDDNYKLLDCQVYNEHLALLGAYEIPRERFLSILKSRDQEV